MDAKVRIKRFVAKQGVELDTLDQRGDADRVVPVPQRQTLRVSARQQDKADEIAQSVSQRQVLGRQAASGTANGLAFSPPFAPWP